MAGKDQEIRMKVAEQEAEEDSMWQQKRELEQWREKLLLIEREKKKEMELSVMMINCLLFHKII